MSMNEISLAIDRFMDLTAWEMTPPRAYGPFHLIFTFVGIALCIFLAYKLRNLSERGHRILMFCVGLTLLIFEVYKQLFHYYHINDHEYNFGIFPFHLCSVPMYLCLIVPFLKKGKLQSGIYGFMTTFNLLGGIMTFIEPSGITLDHLTLTLHAFIWHMSLIFIGFYLIASGRFAKTSKDYWSAAVTFVVLCGVAFIINLSLWEVSDGGINMFFVGPRNSSLAVFKQISEAAGWYVSTLLYIPAVCAGAYLLYLPAHLYAKKKGMIGEVNESQPEKEKEECPVG